MSEDEQADAWLVAYLRLLHDYMKLQARYEHARAAIDNDLWADDQARRQSECPF